MASKKQSDNASYLKLKADLKAGAPERLYAFFGEERYLLEHSVGLVRALVAEGTEEFNLKRLNGKTLTWQELEDAVDSVPMFSDWVVVEVQDYDFGKLNEEIRREFIRILSDIPDYAVVVFVFPGEDMKIDGRIKANLPLRELFTQVDFIPQEGSDILKWVASHVKAAGKKIDRPTAEYLVYVTGGLMTSMTGEIEKLCAYADGEFVTREDIDAVVTPSVEAAVWDVTNAISDGNMRIAAKKLGDLLTLNENPNGAIYVISQKMRQIMSVRAMLDSGGTSADIQKALGLKDFQIRGLIAAARKTPIQRCRRNMDAVLDAALKLNSNYRKEKEIFAEMIARLTV